MTQEYCSSCRILPVREGTRVEQNHKDGVRTLLLVDYPTIEDCELGKTMTGLNRRSTALVKLLDEAGISQDAVSFASVVQCVTRSKAILTMNDYRHCAQHVLRYIDLYDISIIMCFGSVPAQVVMEVTDSSIDNLRGRVFRDNNRTIIVTYALSLATGQGCSGCGQSVYPHLMRKDLAVLRNEMLQQGAMI